MNSNKTHNGKDRVWTTKRWKRIGCKGDPSPVKDWLIVKPFTIDQKHLQLHKSTRNDSISIEGGRILPVNRRQAIFPNGTLTIENVQRSLDQGTYTCVAKNKQGFTATGNLEVQVMGKLIVHPIPFHHTGNSIWYRPIICKISVLIWPAIPTAKLNCVSYKNRISKNRVEVKCEKFINGRQKKKNHELFESNIET